MRSWRWRAAAGFLILAALTMMLLDFGLVSNRSEGSGGSIAGVRSNGDSGDSGDSQVEVVAKPQTSYGAIFTDPKWAFAVIFTDPDDVLVLERAWALWNSLVAVGASPSRIMAIVPRVPGSALEAPLRDMGFRVIASDGPAPAFRTSGRVMQQALASGQGRNLLALEALLLDEYEEVLVLDQKMILIPSGLETKLAASTGEATGGATIPTTPVTPTVTATTVTTKDTAAGVPSPPETGSGSTPAGKTRALLRTGGDDRDAAKYNTQALEAGAAQARKLEPKSGDGMTTASTTTKNKGDNSYNNTAPEEAGEGSNIHGNVDERSTGFSAQVGVADEVLQPFWATPKGENWRVGFSPLGNGSTITATQGAGFESLPAYEKSVFGVQHAGLLVVRPERELYDELRDILCQGDDIFFRAYGHDLPESENKWNTLAHRAPAAPLLHLAMEYSSGAVSTWLLLEVCGDIENGGKSVAWCRRVILEDDQTKGGTVKGITHDEAEEQTVGKDRSETLDAEVHESRRQRRWMLTIGSRGGGGGGGGSLGESHGPAAEEIRDPSQRKLKQATTSAGEAMTGDTDNESSRRSLNQQPTADDEELLPDRKKNRTQFLGEESSASARGMAEFEIRLPDGKLPEGSRVLLLGASLEEGRVVLLETQEEPKGTREQNEAFHASFAIRTTTATGAADQTIMADTRTARQQSRGLDQEVVVTTPTPEATHDVHEVETMADQEAGRQEGDGGEADTTPCFAWIPEDPCSGVDVPGGIGEACRYWVWAARGGVWVPGGPPAGSMDEALQSCRDGAFQNPRSVPSPTLPRQLHKLAMLQARATAPPARIAPNGKNRQRSEGEEQGEPAREVPPPIWQERPKENVVVTSPDLRSFQHFWLANEKHKVLMVAIPKVACTQLHALFLRMLGSEGWDTHSLAKIHFHKDQHLCTLSSLPGMTPERATEIMNDPLWTKGVFFRDPAERLLSCFLDKIVHRQSYSLKIFKADSVLSFEQFVELLSPDAKERFGEKYASDELGLSPNSNPHWRPQLYFGMEKFLPYFDFVGDFQHIQEHSEALLRRAGIWEDFGASGWGPDGKDMFFQRTTVQGHATGSSHSKSLYYSMSLLSTVREAYSPTDYRMFSKLGWWNTSMPI